MHETSDKTQTIDDLIDPARATAMHATLGLGDTAPQQGNDLPPFWHHIYFWDPKAPDALGRDGHPKVGTGLIPDLGLGQRMWAGGALDFIQPITIGMPATKISRVESVVEKTGRSGKLGFVTLRHQVFQNQILKVSERQDIVYKVPSKPGAHPQTQQARTDETVSVPAQFDTTLLFRYSALTFNGHRIHYDLDYCKTVEGYAGLVVHGPLLAQHLIQLANRELGAINTFEFRAVSPLMHFEGAEICMASDGEMWVRGPGGRLCMTARAS